jgi:putative nucleotidyltransferase with HDIG domain
MVTFASIVQYLLFISLRPAFRALECLQMEEVYKKILLEEVFKEKKKEYSCHLQFVVKIGLDLAKDFDVDPDVIEVACLLHDIGRDKELPGERHSETGARIAKDLLSSGPFSAEDVRKILDAIAHHNSEEVPASVEARIVRTADAGSKVEYHEAFMLMCRKETHQERLTWGTKYLEKGYRKICIESYRDRVEEKYRTIRSIYEQVRAAE